MKPTGLTIVFLSFCLLVFGGVALAGTMYSKKDGVKVTVGKSPLSAVVEKLGHGDAVKVLGISGRHAKVQLSSGKVGWVFKFKLSEKKVDKRRGRSALSILSGEERIAAREARSGGSIRGLKEVSETYAKGHNIAPAHKEAVDRMEQLRIPAEELIRFQQEGQVGEFSGGEQ